MLQLISCKCHAQLGLETIMICTCSRNAGVMGMGVLACTSTFCEIVCHCNNERHSREENCLCSWRPGRIYMQQIAARYVFVVCWARFRVIE